METIKIDSQSRIPFSELQYAFSYQLESRLSPSMQPQPPSHYHPRQPPPPPSHRRLSSHDLLYPYGIYETDDSFTPPKYTPEDYNAQEVGVS